MKNKLTNKSKILITIGDPAGIGIEIILKALGIIKFPEGIQPCLVGCRKTIEMRYEKFKSKDNHFLANPANLEIENIPFNEKIIPGKGNLKTGDASFKYLNHATNLILNKQASALVTGPIAKYAWHAAGHFYDGQTELLAKLDGITNPSMLFTAVSPKNGWRLNTLLATTHISLKEVPEALSPEKINSKLDDLLKFCKKFKVKPKLAIAGLNPHSGEEGKIGTEESDWLIPTINKWKAMHPEIILAGPLPPDTCWLSAAKSWKDNPDSDTPDGILALYHDQGLIAVKLIAFDYAVNTTLGLSFVRTSPDHGTAFDIANKGIARPESMISAIKTAWELSKKNNFMLT